jgi:hypothetical protein
MARSFTQQYHDNTLKQGKVMTNPDGTQTSVFSTTVQDPSTGKWYNVPGFDRDAKRRLSSDEALNKYLPDIRAGKVKAFGTGEEAVKAAEEEHKELDMADPQAGLFKDLFNKSGDELKKIEKGAVPKEKLAPVEEPLNDEDAEIMKRVKELRKKEGRNPETGKMAQAGGILQEGEFDDFAPDVDPMLKHLQGEDPASPGEERQLKQVVKGATDFIFGEDLPTVVKSLRGGQDLQTSMEQDPENLPETKTELYQNASLTAFEIIKREKAALERSGEKFEPSVFFAETGAVPLIMDALWEVAIKTNIAGAQDQDQYAGAIINTFKLAGEYIAETGDEDALQQAEDLAIKMTLTRPDGTMMDDFAQADQAEQYNTKRNAVAEGVGNALLGGQA